MKKGVIVSIILVLALVFVIAAPKPPVNPCPIKTTTDIVIYGQTGLGGVGTPSKSWMTHYFDWLITHNPGLEYVFVDANDLSTDCVLTNYPNIKLYVQPGGDAYYMQKAIGSNGKNNIKNYLATGGKYLGTCAGWYYAAGDYYWQGNYYAHSNLLGLYPTVEGSITDIADYESNNPYAITSLSNGFSAMYYGGPTQGWHDTSITLPTTGEVLTMYTGGLATLPAIIKTNNLLLTSVHLEAYENDGITGLTTEQRLENYKLLGNYLNQHTGLGLVIPAYAAPKQCNDGLDNDADGQSDYPQDTDCNSINDDTETPSNDLLNEDFETGNFNGWTISGTGKLWKLATSNPNQGSFYAEANQPGSGTPTILERSISTAGKTGIHLEYYQKLIGLDATDYFTVEWYDGQTWNILERTNNQHNAGYQQKQYRLPVNAGNNPYFKLRFICVAGAVSEYCRIDNIRLYTN